MSVMYVRDKDGNLVAVPMSRGSVGNVSYDEAQNLTPEQKAQARENIEAQPAGNYALKTEIPTVPVQSVNGKTGAVQLSAFDVKARPDNWMPTAQEVGALPNTYTPPNQTAEQVGADPKGTASSTVSQHNTADDSHSDIRLELKAINDRLTAFFDSDNQTLDELSEIVAYITSNKSLIDSITTSKVSVADIIDNLTTNVSNKPLSAAQGVALKDLIDAIVIPTKVSELTNDKGYLTSYTEKDPTVPAWAKASTKPTYTAKEVGADASGTATSAISAHNTSTTAHADIREEINNLSSEIANIPSEVYVGSGTPANGEKIQVDLDGEGDILSIPEVLQTTGTSTVDTMSQKAITDALSNATVSDTKIATAVKNYIAENPISGSNGKDGRGIVSTTRTSGTGAAGTTDTYTMTYTDNTTSTFTVYNGKNGTNGTNGKSAYSYAQSGGYTGTESAFTAALAKVANYKTETWTFTLEDGSTVPKTVVLL